MTESFSYPDGWYAKRVQLIATCEHGHREYIGYIERQDTSPPNIYGSVAELAEHTAEDLGGCQVRSWRSLAGLWPFRWSKPLCKGYVRVHWEVCDGNGPDWRAPAGPTMRNPALGPEGFIQE